MEKNNENQICFVDKFSKFWASLGGYVNCLKNVGPDLSVVHTQTNRQTDRQAKYKNRLLSLNVVFFSHKCLNL